MDLKPLATIQHTRWRRRRCYNQAVNGEALSVESVRTGLRNIMKDLLRSRPQDEAVILAWPLVCGKEVAARTAAVGFADGVLTVEASDREWQAQLSGFSARYVAAFTDLLGPVVRQVKFVIKKPATGNTSTGSERQQ